jgi:hypothetical protein
VDEASTASLWVKLHAACQLLCATFYWQTKEEELLSRSQSFAGLSRVHTIQHLLSFAESAKLLRYADSLLSCQHFVHITQQMNSAK